MACTVKRVAKLLIFYAIFYFFLAAFFAGMMAVFYQTLDEKMPKWQLDNSLIGDSPGLAMRPVPVFDQIQYNTKDFESGKYWKDQLDNFLKGYFVTSQNAQYCDHNGADPGKFCAFKMDHTFIPCLRDFNYGYDSQSPCIFLKLNKIFGWVPDCYNSSTIPDDMPRSLVAKIEEPDPSSANQLIWVECGGEDDDDRQHLGTIQYHPSQGFHKKYYPYANVEGYLSPLVAVQFVKPQRGVSIKIECKAWAKNILHDRKYGLGLVRFQLKID